VNLRQPFQGIFFKDKGEKLMKKTIIFSLAVAVILALIVIPTTPTSAKASKITTCALQTNTSEVPGKVWFTEDGTVLHIRGQITYSDITPLPGHPECDSTFSNGTMMMELNLNLNLVTGEGNAFGSHTITAKRLDASWVGSYTGKIDPSGYAGQAVSHGTGAWEGYVQRVSIQQTGETTYVTFGYVLIP
jgi:hypothetical protein